MAKNRYFIIFILFLYCCSCNSNKNVSLDKKISNNSVKIINNDTTTISTVSGGKVTVTSNDAAATKQEKVLSLGDIYIKYVGVREKTGNNDGPEVELFLKSVGLGKGYSWCAAFVHFCLTAAKIPNTITAWSPTAHNPKNIVWFERKLLKPTQQGDVFTLYSSELKRIHHTGFVDKEINENIYQTVEGNTNAGGSSNGDGVYERKRSYNATYSITRWEKLK